jgi:hypothetical protein
VGLLEILKGWNWPVVHFLPDNLPGRQ